MRAKILDESKISELHMDLKSALLEQVRTKLQTDILSEKLSLLEAQTYLNYEFLGKNAEARQAETIVLLSTSEAVTEAREALREGQRKEGFAKARAEIAVRKIQLWIAAARETTIE